MPVQGVTLHMLRLGVTLRMLEQSRAPPEGGKVPRVLEQVETSQEVEHRQVPQVQREASLEMVHEVLPLMHK